MAEPTLLPMSLDPKDLTEADFQQRVIDYARLTGWHIAHFLPAMNRRGRWSTPQQGHPGFPDLVLVRNGRVLLVELKAAKGRFRPGQKDWLTAAGECGRLWRPTDWPTILEELR